MSKFVSAELKLVGGLTERFFDLLAAVEATGSISQAARKIGMSYKGAWELLERASNFSPCLLIAKEVGGRRGGGARLTQPGKELLSLFDQVREQHRQFMEDLNARLRDNAQIRTFFQRLEMKISPCNQLLGRIERMRVGYVEVEVDLGIKGGHTITALVTQLAADALKLRPGMDVLALIDAPQVILVKDFGGYRLSAGNQLSGTVERIENGAVNTEVIVYLSDGDFISAISSRESFQMMELKLGDAVTAVFDPESIILGLGKL